MRSLLIFVVVLFFSAGCDQAVKQLATDRLGDGSPVSLAGDTVRFELATNSGGFLSLGADLPPALRRILFVALVPVSVLLVAFLMIRSGSVSAPAIAGLGLFVGGGLGNWIDRVVHDGAVTDFVSVGVAGLRTGIFNVADVCIVAGMLLLACATSGTTGPRPRDGPDASA